MKAIADVELGEGPCGEGGVEEPCRDEVRNDGDTACMGIPWQGGTEGDEDIAGSFGGLPEPRH